MLGMKVVTFFLLGLVTLLTSCSMSGGATFVFYVVIKPDEASKFIEAVISVAKEDGLRTAVGETAFGSGDVLRVVEGRGNGSKLWVQSVPLSGHEDPKLCGVYNGPHPDPAQFIVFTEPRLFGSKAAADQLGKRILSQLQKLGFDVRQTPLICGAAALVTGLTSRESGEAAKKGLVSAALAQGTATVSYRL
jgi:hypothetical protein